MRRIGRSTRVDWVLPLVVSIYLACGLPLLALDPQKEISRYGHQVWQTDNGLPQNTVHAILQTHDGYIWLATEGGLVRFDGINFVIFDKQNTSQIKSNYVRSLLEDRAGALWISTAEGLTRLQDSKFTTFTTAEGLPNSSIWSVYEDRGSGIWVVTAAGLAQYQQNHFNAYTAREGLSSDSIGALREDSNGSLWIGTSDGLDRLKDGRFTHYKNEGLAHVNISSLSVDKDGKLWIGTQEGLKFLDGERLSTFTAQQGLPSNGVEILHTDQSGRLWIGTQGGLAVLDKGKITSYTSNNGLPGSRIETIYEDKTGSLWISTNRGVARFRDGRFAAFTPKEGLSSNIVLSIFEDREGSLWLGTESGGLNQLRDQKFTTYTTKEGLSDDLVRSIYQDRNEKVWIGTNGGGLNLLERGKFTNYNTDKGLSSNIILALSDDQRGDLWVGTPDGLSRFRNGKFTTFTSADGLADNFVRSIYEDRESALWIGTRRGLSRLKDGKFTTYTSLDGLANDFVGALLQDHAGNLWVGTLDGLGRFKDGTFTNYTTGDGLSSNVITALYEDSSSTLWIGTNGGGLNLLRDGKLFRYPAKQGLPEVVYRILEDGNENLWMSSNKGIFRVNRKELDEFANGRASSIGIVSYGTADGMKIVECSGGGHPSAWKTKNGQLWFSTIKGVAMIDPGNIRLNQLPPPVTVEQVSVDDQIIHDSDRVAPAQDHTRFAFRYAGLSFVAPQKVRFKYKLEGFDKEWVDAGMRRVAFYTNIPPGNYKFRVLACNNDGVWNESGASFAFYLRPHFYQTYWFYTLCALLLGLFGWSVYHLRLKRVESQFAAVLAERTRIAREIHDTLAQGFAGISVQLEVVARMLPGSTADAKEPLDRARILARTSLAEARRSIWDLRSQNLEHGDLAAGLSKSAKELTADTPIKVQFQVTGTFRQLPKDVENNLLRIGQEAITNAVRHGQARHINVGLQFDSKRVRLSVRDDGRGFIYQLVPPTTNGRFGLIGMRERAEQIGGQLAVDSTPGEGTQVTVETVIS